MAIEEQSSHLGRVGRYQLLEPIASGGMGAVYLARLSGELGFEKLLALKLLLPEISSDRRSVEMFLDEARIAARLSHPNVCEIFELGEDDGRHFIAMQYLRGVPMTEVMRAPADNRAAQIRLIASLAAQAAEGLHHAHELRDEAGEQLHIIHRDVSPPNLFVTIDGVVKVLDFGIAKARDVDSKTQRNEVKGKQTYMSPEQLAGQPLDRRSDIFSLAIVLYEGITNTRLFARSSEYLVAKAILEEAIEPPVARRPEVAEALSNVTLRALERSRDKRFATAREFGEAIVSALGGEVPLSAMEIGSVIAKRFSSTLDRDKSRVQRAMTTTTVAQRPRGEAGRRPRRWPTVMLLGGLVLVAGIVATLFALRKSDEPSGGEAAPKISVAALPSPDAPPPPRDAGATFDARSQAPEATIAKAERRGRISIDSTPYATIYVDGKRAGVTPLINFTVKAGRRRIKAVSAEGGVKRFTIKVRPGRLAAPKILAW